MPINEWRFECNAEICWHVRTNTNSEWHFQCNVGSCMVLMQQHNPIIKLIIFLLFIHCNIHSISIQNVYKLHNNDHSDFDHRLQSAIPICKRSIYAHSQYHLHFHFMFKLASDDASKKLINYGHSHDQIFNFHFANVPASPEPDRMRISIRHSISNQPIPCHVMCCPDRNSCNDSPFSIEWTILSALMSVANRKRDALYNAQCDIQNTKSPSQYLNRYRMTNSKN